METEEHGNVGNRIRKKNSQFQKDRRTKNLPISKYFPFWDEYLKWENDLKIPV